MESAEVREQFSYITHCAGIDFFKEVQRGMNEAASLLNVGVSFEGTEDFNLEEHLSFLEIAISKGVAGIATSIIDAEAFKKPIEKAIKAGIPVIAFNTDASEGTAGQLATVCQDTYAAGRKLGHYIIQNSPRTKKILITFHSDSAPPLINRGQGIREVLENSGISIETLVTGNGTEISLNTLKNYLAGRDDITTLVGTGQDDTEAIGTWISNQDSPIDGYGFDYNKTIQSYVKKDILQGVIDQQPYAQGFYPLIYMWLYNHKHIQPMNINPGMKLHTPMNIC